MDIINFKKMILSLDQKMIVNENNLTEKSMEIPLLTHQYIDIYSKELRILKQLEADKGVKYGELYKFYKYQSPEKWDSKGEIDSQINSNKDYYDLKVKCNEQEAMLTQIEACLTNIKNMSFHIKNIIEYRKLFGV